MARQHDPVDTAESRSIARRVARWQATRAGRARMPEALWDEALALAGQVGVYQAAAVLGLSYSTLKRRFDAEVQGPELTAEVPAFVEWLAPAVGGSVAECVVEFESPRGARLRLEMKGVPAQGLAGLLLSRDTYFPALRGHPLSRRALMLVAALRPR